MNVKKWVVFLLGFLLLLPVFCTPAMAAENPAFFYELTVDGKDTVEVNTGDIITVTLYLNRTDAEAYYTMYSMQDEIRYDSDFFELVEDSALLSDGIQSTDIRVAGDLRELYMSYLSLSGGAQWAPRTRIGSFQLKVIGTSGVTTVTNEDFLVSLSDGSGSYKCEANALTVILSTVCTVRFETNGGTPIDPVTAIYGEKLTRPEDPVREGKRLVGWYKDIHLTEEWNFETDTVTGNMTLYAKWEDAESVPTDENPLPPDGAQNCIICGSENLPIPGIPLCLRCLLILLLLLTLIVWYVCRKRRKKQPTEPQNDENTKQQGENDGQ